MYYAQLANGIVTAITEASGLLDGPNLIPIDTFDVTLLGQQHLGGKNFGAKSTTRREQVLARLVEIDEIGDKPRTRRELTLAKSVTKAWLQSLDDEAVALRTELAGL